ncbi:MAG: non-canonical purine NTP pyrophosphatase [Planctomycetes bacterium]|jgi:XTP/dITP diphosphohydrolase|nr:non-canonical purine NTP pyrophosphatase [Planctomycetota bacterium]MDP6423591.1 non-canonical purine NTP pyrophosphatase [Planctomycetota bacterium]
MSGVELWLATNNHKKAAELGRRLPAAVTVRTMDHLASAGVFAPTEDAPDFAGNARKKAETAAGLLLAAGVAADAIVLADDSGLCVDALDGAPGVLSARWAGEGASDAEQITKLLEELGKRPSAHRSAHFVCSLVAIRVDGASFLSTEQRCEGTISHSPAGDAGFGYDPVFVPAGTSASFAELDAAEKDAVSHRGKALREFVHKLLESL